MTIQFAAYTGSTSTTATLSGTFGQPRGRLAQNTVAGLFGRLPPPTISLPQLTGLFGTFARVDGLFGDATNLLRARAPAAMFFAAEAPPSNTAALSAYFAPLRWSSTAAMGQTTTLTMRPAVAGLFAQDGVAALRGRFAPARTVLVQQRTVNSFVSLLPQPFAQVAATGVPTWALASGLAVGDRPGADFIHALMDLIQFNDTYSQAAQVLQALADGMSLADIAQMILQADLLDSFIASGVLVGTAQVTVLLADGFGADEGASALSTIMAALRDGFYATITLNTGEDVFTAWVMTTQTKAMRSYSNWAFNSYATLAGQFIGAGKDGIYRFGGDKDAGAAIRWAIRTGKLDFGTLQMKGAPLVYIGATVSGDLLLKVQATTVRGQMAEQTYRMTPAVVGEPREHRQQVGRGFRSVYWTFELCNDADGATAQVHEWHAVPVKHTGKLI